MIGRHLDGKKKHSLNVYFLLGCPTANFGLLPRGNLTDLMLITAFDTYLTRRVLRVHESLVTRLDPKARSST